MTNGLYAKGTFTGRYAISEPAEIAQAEFVSAHEFAPTAVGYGAVNYALAEYIAEHCSHLPIYAASRIARALHDVDSTLDVAGEFDLTPSNTRGTRGGTWAEFEQIRSLNPDNWQYPLLVAQSHHVGRVALQARKFGMTPAVPGGLPYEFDSASEQWWCRNPASWATREMLGVPLLRISERI